MHPETPVQLVRPVTRVPRCAIQVEYRMSLEAPICGATMAGSLARRVTSLMVRSPVAIPLGTSGDLPSPFFQPVNLKEAVGKRSFDADCGSNFEADHSCASDRHIRFCGLEIPAFYSEIGKI